MPAGKTVQYPEYDSNAHQYKEYEDPRGLIRPYQASWGMGSASWIDLDAPLD
jgi:hypothetical protein